MSAPVSLNGPSKKRKHQIVEVDGERTPIEVRPSIIILGLMTPASFVQGRCAEFVERKNRFCHMEPAKGSKFCHYHQPSGQQNEQGKTYVACEHCGDRIQSERLARHLKKCNGLLKKQVRLKEPYYREGVNAGSDTEDGSSSIGFKPLSEMTPEEVRAIRGRIQAAYKRAVPQIPVMP